MPRPKYGESVFLNVPFDTKYRRVFRSLIFAVYDCGFVPRCSLEFEDSSRVRVQNLYTLIEESKYGVHDISRAGIKRQSGFARFNMPLELGLFLGAKTFGTARDKQKRCLILDREPYRYQSFCSDIAGQDIRAHHDDPRKAVIALRNWLSSAKPASLIPSGSLIFERYENFLHQLPRQATDVNRDHRDLSYADFLALVIGWLRKNKW